MFNAIVIDKDDSGYRANLQQVNEEQLPEGDVTVAVAYSTLNFKDGLAITGSSPVVRKFPMVPGIDLAGTVEVSSHPDYQAGDQVLLNGWGAYVLGLLSTYNLPESAISVLIGSIPLNFYAYQFT